jgi:hypothetical protein
MRKAIRWRFWSILILATVSGFLAALTLLWPTWIEGLTGLELDNGSGSLELLVTLAFAAASLLLAVLARHEWRLAKARVNLV